MKWENMTFLNKDFENIDLLKELSYIPFQYDKNKYALYDIFNTFKK